MTARSHARAGAVLVAVYAVVAVATTTWAPGRMRPLFDGFGSHPGQYNWVDPPKEFAEGNRPPETAQAGIVLAGPDGSGPASVSPPDGQVLAAVVPKAVPPHPPDEAATLDARPLDPAILGPLPAGLRAESNAYRIAVTYRPSGTPLDKLALPGTVGLTSAAPAAVLLFSADGQRWERRTGSPIPQGTGLTGVFDQTGWYLAAAEGPPRESASGDGAPVVFYVVLALVPLVLAWLLLGQRARRPAKAGPAKGRPGGKPARAAAGGPAAGKAPKPRARRPPGGKKAGKPPPRRR